MRGPIFRLLNIEILQIEARDYGNLPTKIQALEVVNYQ